MVNAQEWLDKNYPKEERDPWGKYLRKELLVLYLDESELAGELDLADFDKLERIYISHHLDENKLVTKRN